MCVCVCVCVCERERERASERAKERNCKTYQNKGCTKTINASSFFFFGTIDASFIFLIELF